MATPAIVLLALFSLSALANVFAIGQPRKPLTHGAAIFNILYLFLLMWLVTLI